MQGLEKLRAVYRDREQAARAVRAAGGKVVGYFSHNVPVELIAASGLFPVCLTGEPRAATDIGDRYMEEFHDGNIRSIFDRMLRGHYNFADLIVIPRTSESYLQLYYYLLEARKWEPQRRFPELYLFDLLQAPNWTVGRYDRGRLDDLRRHLDRVAESTMTDAAIRAAIAAMNESRVLLDEANRLRRRDPAALSGSDMLRIVGAAGFIAGAEHSDCLRAILSDAESLAPLPGKRVMIKGSPQEDDGFYALVESCGVVIAADDHVTGERAFEHRVAEDGDPMEALTDHY
ncbi:MAG: 2-hydroxyacyl-CoA dehydratase, partial [Stellaceae bacterium]